MIAIGNTPIGGGYVEVPNENINLNDWKDYIFIITGESYTSFTTNATIGSCIIDVNAICNIEYDSIHVPISVYYGEGEEHSLIPSTAYILFDTGKFKLHSNLKTDVTFVGIIHSIKAIKIK